MWPLANKSVAKLDVHKFNKRLEWVVLKKESLEEKSVEVTNSESDQPAEPMRFLLLQA